jgi:hypothetical protein
MSVDDIIHIIDHVYLLGLGTYIALCLVFLFFGD